MDVEILYGYGGSGFLLSRELRIGLGDDELIDREPGKSQAINKGCARIGVAEKRRVRGPDEERDDARNVVGIFCPVLESAAWMT